MMFVLILFSTVSQYGRYTLPVGTYVLTVRTVRTDAFSFRHESSLFVSTKHCTMYNTGSFLSTQRKTKDGLYCMFVAYPLVCTVSLLTLLYSSYSSYLPLRETL